MMRGVLETVVRYRIGVALIFALGLLAALWKLQDAPFDVLPAFAPNQVTVQTEAPGYDALQVEGLVTRPVEIALGGAPGLAAIRSQSIGGLSVITLDFVAGSDPYRVRQGVSEALVEAMPNLPSGIGPPRASPLTSATMDLLKVGLTSDTLSAQKLRSIADIELQPAMLDTPGTARVTTYGGDVAEVQVHLDPARMVAFGVSLDDATAAATKALTVQAGGFVETPAQRMEVQTPLPTDFDTLAAAPITAHGARVIRLRDVGTVIQGAAPAFGDAIINGKPGVLLSASGQFGANTLAATRALDKTVADFTPGLERRGVKVFPALHRPASFVESSLGNLARALGLGALFVGLVLIPLLRSWRAALISFIAIPVSLAAAALVLWWMGFALDTMTLGGFAVALGVLVDDAIIDVENVIRRIRNAHRAGHYDRTQALILVVEASLEIRSAMVYATLVVLLAFAPILLQGGVEGAFLRPLATAFIIAVIASLVVALTLTPALSALILPSENDSPTPRWLQRARAGQGRAIRWIAPRANLVTVGVGVLFLIAAGLAATQPMSFVPDFREGHVVIGAQFAQPGVSVEQARATGLRVSKALLALPFVATVEEQIGRAEAGEDTWTVDRSEYHVELKPLPGLDQTDAQERIRAVMAGFPGINSEVLTFLGDRLSETLTGETRQGVIELSSDSLDDLTKASASVQAAARKVPGAVDVATEADVAAPGLKLVVDPAAMAMSGADPSTAATALRAATTGLPIGNFFDQDRAIPAVIRLDTGSAGTADGLDILPVTTPVLGLTSFGRLARLEPVAAQPVIRHASGRRVAVIGFNAQGRSIEAVAADVRAAVERAGLPTGITVRYGGIGAAAREARLGLLAAFAATLILVALALNLAFSERRHVWLVMLNVPFALTGALTALLLTGLPLSLGAAVGLITVFGISARNAVLLLSHYEAMHNHGHGPDCRHHLDLEMCIEGAANRLVAVVATALVAALGLLPLVFGLGQAGHEIEGPLAVAVLGGLLTATPLSLLLLPALAVCRDDPPTALHA